MVVRDIERNEIEFISKTLNCLPIAHVDHMKPEKLGTADLVEEIEVKRGELWVDQGTSRPFVTLHLISSASHLHSLRSARVAWSR